MKAVALAGESRRRRRADRRREPRRRPNAASNRHWMRDRHRQLRGRLIHATTGTTIKVPSHVERDHAGMAEAAAGEPLVQVFAMRSVPTPAAQHPRDQRAGRVRDESRRQDQCRPQWQSAARSSARARRRAISRPSMPLPTSPMKMRARGKLKGRKPSDRRGKHARSGQHAVRLRAAQATPAPQNTKIACDRKMPSMPSMKLCRLMNQTMPSTTQDHSNPDHADGNRKPLFDRSRHKDQRRDHRQQKHHRGKTVRGETRAGGQSAMIVHPSDRGDDGDRRSPAHGAASRDSCGRNNAGAARAGQYRDHDADAAAARRRLRCERRRPG